MAILFGGTIAVILGLVWALLWPPAILSLLQGIVPFVLVLGGAMTIYFGIDEILHPPPPLPHAHEPQDEIQTTTTSSQPSPGADDEQRSP